MPTDDRCIFAELDHAGRACIVVSKYWPDGSRFSRRFPNKTVAKKMRARIEEAIAMGTWRELKKELYEDPKKDLTIEQFSDIYLEEYCRIRNSRPDFKEETLTTIVSIVGHIRVKDFPRKDLAVGVYCGLLGETAMRPEEGFGSNGRSLIYRSECSRSINPKQKRHATSRYPTTLWNCCRWFRGSWDVRTWLLDWRRWTV